MAKPAIQDVQWKVQPALYWGRTVWEVLPVGIPYGCVVSYRASLSQEVAQLIVTEHNTALTQREAGATRES